MTKDPIVLSEARPCIYVVTVTFNMINGLIKTLESVKLLADNLKCYTFKVIVINGNPCDDGRVVSDKYGSLIFQYIAEADRGIYDAMNKGISCLPADGYSIFINSDDELLGVPESLINDDSDALFCNVISFDKETGLREVFYVTPKFCLNASNLLRPRVHHQGFFVRNTVLKQYAYDLEVGIRADVLLMGMILKNHKSVFLNDVVALITTGGKSDCYSVGNLVSFFTIAPKLGISKLSTFFCSLPEIMKYSIKWLIGSRGISLVRRVKFILHREFINKNVSGS